MSWTQTCFGLGYMLGPGVGAWFYEMGGFMLPFLVVGSLSTILSLLLVVTIPNVGGSGIVTFEIPCQARIIVSFSQPIMSCTSASQVITDTVDTGCKFCGNGAQ